MSQIWNPLQKGDVIQIIAPASKISNPEKSLALITQLLEQWQLTPKINKDIFGFDARYPMLANTDEIRLADLIDALTDNDVKAIWCVRGGYGCIRLLSHLEQFAKTFTPQKNKLFIGFSDITLLHIFFNQTWGWKTLHGPVANQAINPQFSRHDVELLRKIMFGEMRELIFDDFLPFNKTAKIKQSIRGELQVGNLTLISRTFGCDKTLQIGFKDKILVIEEEGEPFRKVDGIFYQMKLMGYFQPHNKPKAVIFGDFSIKASSIEQSQVDACLQEFADYLDELKIPVLQCKNIGHGDSNHPLPYGLESILELSEKPRIRIVLKS